MNLAQAVLLYAYELRRAALEAGASAPAAAPAGASDAELAALEDALRTALRTGGFLAGPERHAVRDLAAPLRRARLTRKEARLWAAALRTMARIDRVRAADVRFAVHVVVPGPRFRSHCHVTSIAIARTHRFRYRAGGRSRCARPFAAVSLPPEVMRLPSPAAT